ncbi:MAG: ComF family protein [Candidatus Taylorbacteria bacterium]|nr:ComF family protein [Candidatus Taylorbacteria bacterium]
MRLNYKQLFECLLELLLPRSRAVREIEAMSPADWRRRAGRAAGHLPPDTLALFDYGNKLTRQAIWELKYRGNKKITTLLADCLYEELAEELSLRKAFENFERPLLIPMPLSGKRQRQRGFNQSQFLAAALLERGGGRFFEAAREVLVKVKDTESQTKKNRAERLKNLSGCFAVRSPAKIAGRNVILLDDVTTTGATFEEARKTLARAGAGKILAVAVAH